MLPCRTGNAADAMRGLWLDMMRAYTGVGFCTAEMNMDRLPGWEPQSYGYHGDDGNAFRSDGKGRRYGPTFGTGAACLWLGRGVCRRCLTAGCRLSG